VQVPQAFASVADENTIRLVVQSTHLAAPRLLLLKKRIQSLTYGRNGVATYGEKDGCWGFFFYLTLLLRVFHLRWCWLCVFYRDSTARVALVAHPPETRPADWTRVCRLRPLEDAREAKVRMTTALEGGWAADGLGADDAAVVVVGDHLATLPQPLPWPRRRRRLIGLLGLHARRTV